MTVQDVIEGLVQWKAFQKIWGESTPRQKQTVRDLLAYALSINQKPTGEDDMSEQVTFKFRLGDRVKDRVTEYVGIVDARKQHLNGCIMYSVQGPVDSEKPILEAGWWIDEIQIEFVDTGLNDEPVKKSSTGGPMTRVRKDMT